MLVAPPAPSVPVAAEDGTAHRANNGPSDGSGCGSTAPDAFVASTRQYAASFQPGVSAEGAIPEFASRYFFETKAEEDARPGGVRRLCARGRRRLEQRHGVQTAELLPDHTLGSRASISITCRTSKCYIHMTDIGGEPPRMPGQKPLPPGGPSTAMRIDLWREPWVKLNFSDLTNRGSTPICGWRGLLPASRPSTPQALTCAGNHHEQRQLAMQVTGDSTRMRSAWPACSPAAIPEDTVARWVWPD